MPFQTQLVLSSVIAVARDPSDLELRDVNGDSAPDMLVTDQVSGTVRILLNRGRGDLASPCPLRQAPGVAGLEPDTSRGSQTASWTRVTRDQTAAMALGDFNQDGPLDIATVNRGANSLSLLTGKGTGSFANPQGIFTGSRPTTIITGQLNDDNRDGRTDASDYLDLAVLNEASADIGVYLGDGRGGFAESLRLAAGNVPTGLSLHDVDRDGLVDLVVGNEFGDLMTLRGNGDGTFPAVRAIGS